MTTVPLTDWTRQDREQHVHSVVRGGWLRMPPALMAMLLIGLACEEGPLTREEAQAFVATRANPSGDWQASCWDDEDQAERSADELADLRVQQAAAARYAAHYGLPPLSTIGDVLTLLLAARVVHEIPDADGALRLHPASPLPGPHKVFPLGEDELAVQEFLRRDAAYGGDSDQIIDLFAPLGERHEEITTSLDRLARLIDGHPHDARQALRLLLDAPDFTTTADIATPAPHTAFPLRCHWPTFDAHRIDIQRGDGQGHSPVTRPSGLDDHA